MRHWDMLPECVRPYYVRRVCLLGPESSGKSTLARDLAHHFNTSYAWEYARPLLNPKGGRCDRDDISLIARGQIATEEALARHANRVLFVDTNVLLTTIWSQTLFGTCPEWVRRVARERRYDLHLLLDVDVPWVDDGQRYFPMPADRVAFFERCRETLEREQLPYIVIRGSWEQRREQAIHEVRRLLAGSMDNA